MIDPATPEGRAEIRRCGAALPCRLLDLVEAREREVADLAASLTAATAEIRRLRDAIRAIRRAISEGLSAV